jgi:hypothetical protein
VRVAEHAVGDAPEPRLVAVEQILEAPPPRDRLACLARLERAPQLPGCFHLNNKNARDAGIVHAAAMTDFDSTESDEPDLESDDDDDDELELDGDDVDLDDE